MSATPDVDPGRRSSRRRAALAHVVVVAALTVAGCTRTVLVAGDYNQSCVANNDCAIQQAFGDQCAACIVEQTAIHRDEIDRLHEAMDAAAAACPPWSDRFHVECVVPIPAVRPICADGTCAVPDEGTACTFEDGACRGVDD